MVVGILAIIGMLGGAFLIFARVDARQGRSLAARNASDHIPASVLAMVGEIMAQDLYISSSGLTYGGAATPSATHYIDSPLPTQGTVADTWLSCFEPVSGNWPHISDITGENSSAYYNVAANTGSDDYVDTDGDGVKDSRLVDAGVTNLQNERYYYAVRVIDNSGLANVNTGSSPDRVVYKGTATGGSANTVTLAGSPAWQTNIVGTGAGAPAIIYITDGPGKGQIRTGTNNGNTFGFSTAMSPAPAAGSKYEVYTPVMGPLDMDLQRLVGTSAYNSLATARAPNIPAERYFAGCGVNLLTANTNVGASPFGITDELALRWRGTIAQSSNYRLMAPSAANGNYLTTWNASRAVQRFPDSAAGTSRMDPRTMAVALGAAQVATRTRLNAELQKVLPGDTTNRNTMAAHIVSNMWASVCRYLTTTMNTERGNVCFKGTNSGGPVVYGVVEQLAISEIYAYSLKQSGSNDDSGWAYAVELINPTDLTVRIAGTGGTDGAYQHYMKFGVSTTVTLISGTNGTMNVPGTLDPGAKLVLYHFGGQFLPSGSAAVRRAATAADFGFATTSAGVTWALFPACTNIGSSAGTIELWRKITVGTDQPIPVDYVTKSDCGYNISNRRTNDGGADVVNRDAWRDNDLTRQQAFVGGAMTGTALVDPTGHKLGPAAHTSNSGLLQGYNVMTFRQTVTTTDFGPASLADFNNIYVTGPEVASGTFLSLPQQLAGASWGYTRGKLDPWGPVGTIAASYNYPEVPVYCLLPEWFDMVPNDTTRPFRYLVYGRVNINTAPSAVLQAMPWPRTLTNSAAGSTLTVDPAAVAAYIIAYRDRGIAGSRNYANRSTAAGPGDSPGVPNLRASTAFAGYLTPGEIAIPLADYADDLLLSGGRPASDRRQWWYRQQRDSLYRSVANLVTVSSDVYTVYVTVQLGKGSSMKHRARYVAVLDRSYCRSPSDRPVAVLPLVRMD
jgi:hypothetical protein